MEGLTLTHDKLYLVSSSYDSVKFWPTTQIPTMWVEPIDVDVESKANRKRKKRKSRKQLIQAAQQREKKSKTTNDNFFCDL